jgi:hypothetical protein
MKRNVCNDVRPIRLPRRADRYKSAQVCVRRRAVGIPVDRVYDLRINQSPPRVSEQTGIGAIGDLEKPLKSLTPGSPVPEGPDRPETMRLTPIVKEFPGATGPLGTPV